MSLRTEPIQARSTARLHALLDATADVVAEVGVERLTTNLVAERAGAAIGTLYRYFPDRIAVLRGLALRHATAVHGDVSAALESVSDGTAGLRATLETMTERFIERYRDEPGWSAIGFDNTLDTPLHEGEQQLVGPALRTDRSPREQIAHDVAERFTVDDDARNALADDVGVVTVLVHQLVERAFVGARAGDERLLAIARGASSTAIDLVTERFEARAAA
ncbi:AcrR family transcriptional regulator [Pseudoclavibacter chungangensis]|uniref:TetR/AcrR family transcriptional regulator n=1 Tax=Pseudoclavibacter chungangensis TaxID=587635 RepID=UPI0015CC958D|nr:TetR/AcrR family transcriptional regulator [Pseudoclavibacter chungangensis]NYJ67074.1 AcrR family transcriptional regulator [Pseudoclavibacter chungangensis]